MLTVAKHNEIQRAKDCEDRLSIARHLECLPQANKGRQEERLLKRMSRARNGIEEGIRTTRE